MNGVEIAQCGDTLNFISGGAQRLYLVEVTQQGTLLATHTIEAPDALTAINLIESYYSEPTRVEKVLIEDETGDLHQVMLANNWHGYMFEAQAIRPAN